MKRKKTPLSTSDVEHGPDRLSSNFLLAELVYSETASKKGIRNIPTKAALKNLRHLASTLEQVVRLLGYSISISSGYRSKALNAAVGGSKTSHHVQGLAVDFTCKQFGTPFRVCKRIAESDIEFDQLILEYGKFQKIAWVHLGIGSKMRRHILTMCASHKFSGDGLHRFSKKKFTARNE